MSKNIFFISDTHFGHANMCNFLNWDGTKARNFDNYIEADETMIQNWNNLVSSDDIVYVLGDIAYSCTKEYADSILVKKKKKKKLIAGNHDLWSTQWYLKHFKYVRGCMHLDNYYLSHTPIHIQNKGRFKLNIHGHIHNATIRNLEPVAYYNGMDTEIVGYTDKGEHPFYYNVSVDYNYRYSPIPYEEIQEYYQKCLDEGVLEPIKPKERL